MRERLLERRRAAARALLEGHVTTPSPAPDTSASEATAQLALRVLSDLHAALNALEAWRTTSSTAGSSRRAAEASGPPPALGALDLKALHTIVALVVAWKIALATRRYDAAMSALRGAPAAGSASRFTELPDPRVARAALRTARDALSSVLREISPLLPHAMLSRPAEASTSEHTRPQPINDVSAALVRSAVPALLGAYLRLGCGPLCVERGEQREAQAKSEALTAERDMIAILRKCVLPIQDVNES